MYAQDFEYDGMRLSDFGLMICTFNSSGVSTVSSGADISFNIAKSNGSNKFSFYGSKYDSYYTMTFEICKSDLYGTKNYIEPNVESSLQRWLCRKDGYHKLSFVKEGYEDIYWNATFSAKQISLNDKIIGMELTIYTDAPFAYLSEQTISYTMTAGSSVSLFDMSDEVGSIYPQVEIICGGTADRNGNVKLQNSMDRKILNLSGLSAGETILLNGEKHTIKSSFQRDNLASSFNFYYPKIINTINNRENVYALSDDSIPITIKFTYSPIIKVGL